MHTAKEKARIKRNIVIYVLGAYALSIGGGVIMASGEDAGGLLFIIGPLLMMVLLRLFGGDGWRDAGLGLKLKDNWGWYAFSLLVYPLSFVVLIALGMLGGLITVNHSLPDMVPLFLASFAANLVPRTLFALLEEWGWRGYLEPRFSALGMPDLKRYLIVGVIWAIWHFPLILATDYTAIPPVIFLPMFTIGVTIAAITYGQVRKASGTVWTAVLMHGTGNVVAFAVLDSNLMTFSNKLLVYITPESVLTIFLWSVLGWWLLRTSRSSDLFRGKVFGERLPDVVPVED